MKRSRSSSRERRCRRLSRSRDRHRRSRSSSRDRENSPKRSSSRYHRRRRRSRSFSSGPPRYRRRNSSDKESEKEIAPPLQLLDGDKMIADTLATIALTRMKSNDQRNSSKRKRSRWVGTEHDKIFIPGMPTTLPANLDKHQEQAYLLQLQIEELSRRLRTGDLGIPLTPEERSPSPEPIYSSDGKRLNTREFRTRKRLEEERHALVLKMQKINPDFKPPGDYKPPVIKVTDYVRIPQDEYPEINFVGLLIGPRGNTLKLMEKETGAKIIIRGKGSVKEGKVGRKDGQPLPGEDEPLHAYITANNPESVKTAMEKVREIIKQGIETPEDQNNLRRMQLRELALLNGTLRENNSLRCMNCGATEHKTWMCQDKLNLISAIVCSSCGAAGHIARDCLQKNNDSNGISATDGAASGKLPKIDEEYMSLMAELAEESNSETKSKQNKNVPTWKNCIQPSTTPQQLPPPPPTFKDMPIITDPLPIASGSKSPTWPSGDHLVNIPWPSTSTNTIPYLQPPVPPPATVPVGSWNLPVDPRIATEGTTLPLWPQYQPFTTWYLPPPPGVDATVAGILSVPPPPPPK